MKNTIEADDLRQKLTPHDHRRIFKACGFKIGARQGTQLSDVLGPKELGEGETGSFSVNLESGLVRDWGSTEYKGHVFKVVQDVHGMSFPEALAWIVDRFSIRVPDNSRVRGDSTPTPTPTIADTRQDEPESLCSGEPAATKAEVLNWHERLMGDTDAAQAAREYLTGRGITADVLNRTLIGLAHTPKDYRAQWWIMIPVPCRMADGFHINAVKGFGFDVDAKAWKRKDGRKVARNGGSAALYDLTPGRDPIDGPVLLCEGEIDALSALSHEFNAVSGTNGASTFKGAWAHYISGSAPAQEHGVIVAFDGDDAGRKGAQKAAETLHGVGVDVRIASLPDGQDVNDVLVTEGRDALTDVLDRADAYEQPQRNDRKRPEAKNFRSEEGKVNKVNSELENSPGKVNKVNGEPGNATKPEPEKRLEWQDFPLTYLPKAAQRYIRGLEKSLNVDPALLGVPVLTVLAAAVGNSHRIQLQNTWTEPATLWTAVVSRSGTMKSPALDKALKPAKEVEHRLRKEHERDMRDWKAQKDEDKGDQPVPRRRIVNDATVESVAIIHSENPRGLMLYRDELAGWIGSFDRYSRGDADMQTWIEMCDGRSIIVDRKSNRESLHVPAPSVCVTGTIQPEVLREKLSSTHFQSGFAPRLWMCQPPEQKRRWNPSDVAHKEKERYHSLIQDLYSATYDPEAGPTVLEMTTEAEEVFANWYNQNAKLQEKITSGPLRSMLSKCEALAARLALIIQLATDAENRVPSSTIGQDAMLAGVELAGWFRNENARIYQRNGFHNRGVGEDTRSARKLPQTFGWEDILEAFNIGSKRGAFKIIDRLKEANLIEKTGHGEYKNLTDRSEGGDFTHLADAWPV